MKKQFIIALTLLFGASALQAQSLPGFQLGLKGAWNYSTLKSEDSQWLSSSARSGYQLGIWTRVGGAIHVQPELYVTGKSTDVRVEENGGNVQADLSFTTLDLPVLLGSRIGFGGVALRIQAGPLVSFVIDKDLGSTFEDVTRFSEYKNNSFALVGGVGVDIGRLRGDVRYEHAMSSLSKGSAPDQHMNVWTVGVGLRLF